MTRCINPRGYRGGHRPGQRRRPAPCLRAAQGRLQIIPSEKKQKSSSRGTIKLAKVASRQSKRELLSLISKAIRCLKLLKLYKKKANRLEHKSISPAAVSPRRPPETKLCLRMSAPSCGPELQQGPFPAPARSVLILIFQIVPAAAPRKCIFEHRTRLLGRVAARMIAIPFGFSKRHLKSGATSARDACRLARM